MKYTDEKIQQQIEAYLNQDMTDLERSKFEKLIHDDPELHEEVEMQESMMEAIRNERILLMKSSLNQTNVSLWSTGLAEMAKIAAISLSIGLASVGGYYVFQSQKAGQKENQGIVSQPLAEQNPTSASPEPVAGQSSASSSEVPQTFESKPENGTEPKASSQTPNTATESQTMAQFRAKGLTRPQGEKGIQSIPAEKEILEPGVRYNSPSTGIDIPIPTDGISNKTSLESLHPEVVIKRDNKDKFHYQFLDSKLILYADFSDKLYEVLELNQNNEKQLFFAYDGKFYLLDSKQSEISPLKEVQDKNLIQVLSIYQKRKY